MICMICMICMIYMILIVIFMGYFDLDRDLSDVCYISCPFLSFSVGGRWLLLQQ